MTPDILEATSVAGFLADAIRAWCRAGAGRSQRTFAAAAKIALGTLPHVLRGTRKLDPASAADIGRVLELDPYEVEVLHAMAVFERSPGNEYDHNELVGRQHMLRAHRLGTRDVTFLERWSTAAVRELARVEGFREDPAWVADILRPQLSVDEAADTLALLRGSRAAINDLDEIVSTGMQVASGVADDWHEQILNVARSAARLPKDQRFMQSYIAAVAPESVPMLVRAIQRFVNEVAGICEQQRPSKRDRVVQVSVQLLPLTDPTIVSPICPEQGQATEDEAED
ncbi:MAG TPA: TIGR02147 family protein [Myxococcota bacterium]|nr:TIGR02147 family protein [Myxococcota bacterium]